MKQLLQGRFLSKSCLCLLVWLLFWITIDLNLSGLTIILFSENRFITFSDSAISISSSNVTDSANDGNVLSTAKLRTTAFLMQKKESFKNALNNIDPTIEPWGTPKIMSLKSLQTLLIRTHCLRFLKYLKIYFRALQLTPYAKRVLLLVSRQRCNQKPPRDRLTLPPQWNYCQDFLCILQVI